MALIVQGSKAWHPADRADMEGCDSFNDFFFTLYLCACSYVCHTCAEADGGRLEDGVWSDP